MLISKKDVKNNDVDISMEPLPEACDPRIEIKIDASDYYDLRQLGEYIRAATLATRVSYGVTRTALHDHHFVESEMSGLEALVTADIEDEAIRSALEDSIETHWDELVWQHMPPPEAPPINVHENVPPPNRYDEGYWADGGRWVNNSDSLYRTEGPSWADHLAEELNR